MTKVFPVAGGRLFIDAPAAPRALFVVGHGAGGGVGVPDLVALSGQLPKAGIAVARFEQPWRTSGRRIAPAPAVLDVAWGPALEAAVELFPGVALVVGGRSAGARVACRGAVRHDLPHADGVVALAFPLHPPGRPERSRVSELAPLAVPLLLVQGERDPFGTPAELAAVLPDGKGQIVAIPGVAHSLAARSQNSPVTLTALTLVVRSVLDFVDSLVSE